MKTFLFVRNSLRKTRAAKNSCVSRLCDNDSCNFVRLLKHLTPKLCILHRALIKVLSRHSREMKPKKPLFYLLLSCSSCLTKPSQPILIIYGQFMAICVFQLTIRNHQFFCANCPTHHQTLSNTLSIP